MCIWTEVFLYAWKADNSALKVMDFIMYIISLPLMRQQEPPVFIWNGLTKYCANIKTQNGRMELFDIGRKTWVLNLAKNPAGFNQNISAVLEDKSPKDLIVVINDKAQDGKDISWLWDVDCERFHDARVQTFIASGISCFGYAAAV